MLLSRDMPFKVEGTLLVPSLTERHAERAYYSESRFLSRVHETRLAPDHLPGHGGEVGVEDALPRELEEVARGTPRAEEPPEVALVDRPERLGARVRPDAGEHHQGSEEGQRL